MLVAVNCTRPFANLCASALAGVTFIDSRARLGLEVPHPVRTMHAKRNEAKSGDLRLAIAVSWVHPVDRCRSPLPLET